MWYYYIAIFQFLCFQVNCSVLLVLAVVTSKNEFDVGGFAVDVAYWKAIVGGGGGAWLFFMLLIDCCTIFWYCCYCQYWCSIGSTVAVMVKSPFEALQCRHNLLFWACINHPLRGGLSQSPTTKELILLWHVTEHKWALILLGCDLAVFVIRFLSHHADRQWM